MKLALKQWTGTLWSKNPVLSTFVEAKTTRTVVAKHAIVIWPALKVAPRLPVDSMETLHSTTVTSPAGPLFLAASSRGLVALEFDVRTPGQQSIRPNPRDLRREATRPAERTKFGFEEAPDLLRPYATQLDEYFSGQRRDFTVPLDLRGTDFQLACWHALLGIPYGETRTYADIARAVGKPNAFRAVGMANHRNPVAIVVPCHRVIASDGTLCGYGGGLDVKRKLLELEGALSGTLAA
jgi:O-6-methylguanine DNA methyltransferase